MNGKKKIKFFIGMGVTIIIICVIAFVVIKTKEVDKIMLGMTDDEAISILDKNNYNYSVNKIVLII